MRERKKGISLIVLVITIIVMIILATAIILSLSGSDIRGKANEAVNSSDLSTAKEVIAVAQSEWELNYDELKKEYENCGEYATEELRKAGFTEQQLTKIAILTDGSIQINPVIPEGFVMSIYEGEQKISEGLVIYETNSLKGVSKDVAMESYNQFVWVPVDDMSLFERTTTYTGTITKPGGSEPYKTSTYTEEEKEYLAMRASVEKNHGFYIARYEAGKEGTGTVVSKKGATVWKDIDWGTSMTEVGTSGAVYYSRQMYNSSKLVVSTLCYGVQWDSALQFISTKNAEYITDGEGKGNYTGKLLTSGYSEDYKANNIYDMAGNVSEWTMEASDPSRTLRGGCYADTYSTGRVARRGYNGPTAGGDYDGFRVALYIK